MRVAAVHRIGSGRQRLSHLTSIRRITRLLTIYYIGSNGQNGHSRNTIAIGMMLADLIHKGAYQIDCDLVYAVIVISVLRIISLNLIIHHDTVLVANRLNLSILDRA